jgi:alginate O-acetyltransferase complex protein AlgI
MVFSSLIFIYFFLPVSLLAYFLIPSMKGKNFILLIFSLLFYAWGEPIWITLLLFSSIVNYFMALYISNHRGSAQSKLALLVSVCINIGLLMTFKYADFFVDNTNWLFGTAFTKPGITLPLGISFYTFLSLSYTLDVHRGHISVQKSFLNFMVYVTMFPHLVAGPIVRYSEIQDTINNRKTSWDMVWSGINRFCLGLFKKVVIANTASILVEKYLEVQFMNLSSPEAWFGITLFSIQIYFDFSGYSDMAIGLGRIFGFNFLENFRHPYAATSVGDFYKRWHMSLGRFFRDYVYIPLGGNRKFQLRNIFIVWLLTGFWHGASWNFVLWGAFFGCCMILEKLLQRVLNVTPRILKHSYTLILIVFSRAIFYYVDFEKLKVFTKTLFSSEYPVSMNLKNDLLGYIFFFVTVIILCIPWNEIFKEEHRVYKRASKFYFYGAPVINILLLLLGTVLLIDDTYNPFIYFRF